MINLFKKIYKYDEVLSKEAKDKILKHKRRIEYFFIFIPSMFILLGYLTNSIKTNNFTSFKLTRIFLVDFISKVTINIIPIITIATIISLWIITIYKPKVIKGFWLTLIFCISMLLLVSDFKKYIFEFMYQAVIIWNEEKFLICVILLTLLALLLITKRINKLIISLTKSGFEIFLISSVIYLELTDEYSLFFFTNNFIKLFMNGLRFLNGIGEIFILIFVTSVFLSLYSNKLKAIIFFIKNKVEMNKEIKDIEENPENYPNLEIVQVTDKIKMPLLVHQSLPVVAAVVPAFNEFATAPTTIDSLLKIDYDKDKFFIFVVSDGSTDSTVDVLINKYDMYKTMINQTSELTKRNKAKSIYKSRKHKHLILIDKPNGGKSDALNLGLEYLPTNVQYMSVIDADSIVDKYSFRIFATIAQRNDKIVALTGTVLPRSTKKTSDFKSTLLTNVQLFDYLSSFHGERGALSLLNAVLIVPGAFGFFDKWTLLELEGYPRDVLAEDGILTVNLHSKKNAIIKFVPEAISYTQVPSTFKDLRKQRIRWFKGLTELLMLFKNTWKENIKLSLVFLEYLLVEWVTPIMIPIGICILISNPKMITHSIFQFFILLAIVTPMIKGILCMIIESSYRKVSWSRLIYLPLSVLISPLIVLWRNDALLDLGNKNWGFIKRY